MFAPSDRRGSWPLKNSFPIEPSTVNSFGVRRMPLSEITEFGSICSPNTQSFFVFLTFTRVIVGGAKPPLSLSIESESCLVLVWFDPPTESLTIIMNEKKPTDTGVPSITPPDDKPTPGGRAPPITLQV